jgi:hypothetical protein
VPIAIEPTKGFCGGEFQYFTGGKILVQTSVAFVWFPILELWEELQVFWQVTVVGTWFKGNIDNSGGC